MASELGCSDKPSLFGWLLTPNVPVNPVGKLEVLTNKGLLESAVDSKEVKLLEL